jgi:hypothetical protein
MPKGIWIWPSDPKGQRRALKRVAESPHLVAALAAMAKSSDGMSNAEVAEVFSDGSEWPTLWVIRQLTSLGFIEFKVDFFGNPARYQITEQGRTALSVITGKPLQKPPSPTPVVPQPAKVPTPGPPAPQPAAPKTA